MARSSPWLDVLEDFRASEPEAPLLFVREDRDLRRMLAAWRMMGVLKRPDDMTAIPGTWDGLWEGVEVDLARLADLLSTYGGQAKQLFERARALRLIYPDGGVHAKALLMVLEAAAAPKEERDDEA
ncbi:MAG: hypothetical protein AB7S87_17240 [Burkholderiales bacterium]